MIAALRLMRLNIFGPWALVKALTVLLGETHKTGGAFAWQLRFLRTHS